MARSDMSEHSKITVLVADDDPLARGMLEAELEKAGFRVILAADGKEAMEVLSDEVTVALFDLKMPFLSGVECIKRLQKSRQDIESIIITASSDVEDAVRAMKSGAFDYLTKPVNTDELIVLVQKAAHTAQLKVENLQLRQAIAVPDVVPTFVGKSPLFQEILSSVKRVAAVDSTVLITGESGVGKSLLARLVHSSGPRREEPFITVSCGALPRELLESELFGHEKGAFTGAHQMRPGRVEIADRGTLFLDEIGELPLDMQPKLLNFLQDHTFYRIGGTQTVSADVRILAATNQDLQSLCEQKQFREDLYFRLNVIPLHIPPLRERKEDIPSIAEYLLQKLSNRQGGDSYSLSEDALDILVKHDWPGNVRELENVLERVTVFLDGTTITPQSLPNETFQQPPVPTRESPSVPLLTLKQIEKQAIIDTLRRLQGNKAAAARQLGISEKSIYNKIKRLEIS
ncbi:MAG: sigma-54 dependent transcriptional regulator [Acidobacteriota bacterium]